MICESLCEIKIKTISGIRIIPAGQRFETMDITSAKALVNRKMIKVFSTDNNDPLVKQSPQCLQCPQTQYQQGMQDTDFEYTMSAMSASDESGAVLSSSSPAQTSSIEHWNGDMQMLIAWFQAAPRPTEPFHLAAHIKVIDPERYFAALEMDIKAGPRLSRARFDVLQSDLLKLKNRMGGTI